MENYYKILNVAENATQDEIKKSFRKLAKENHPDKGGDENTFKKINEAYETLSDENKRNQYDNRNNNSNENSRNQDQLDYDEYMNDLDGY